MQDNPQYYGKELGVMENEINQNMNEVISLISKCYSIQNEEDKSKTKADKNKTKAKGINKSYCEKFHTHEYFKKKYCLIKMIKVKKKSFIT